MKRRDEVLVGVLVTIATSILILGTLWLARGGLKSGYPLYTRFSWGQNLKQGQSVLLAGIAVGYVGDVRLRPGYLDVMLRVEDAYRIPKGSTATVKPIGIFGDVAVALTPPKNLPSTYYQSGDTVPAGPATPDIAEIFDRVDSIGRSTERITHALEVQVVEAGTLRDFQRTVAASTALVTQLQRVVALQDKNVSETMAAFRSTASHLNSAVDSAQFTATMASLRSSSDAFRQLVKNLDSSNTRLSSVLGRLDRGEGSLGKLLRDTTTVNELTRLMRTADSLLADFKANPKKYINVHIF